MRGGILLAICCVTVAACAAPPDPPNLPVSLLTPYSELPDPPPDRTIEPGMPVKLDQPQLDAVVDGVIKWMKDPASVAFADINAVRSRRGVIVVCGDVNGRNSAGTLIAKSPFIGALMGEPKAPEFVVVEIGAFGKERATVETLCAQSGVFKPL
jgi:hypothetical protein